MKIKDGVRLEGVQVPMLFANMIADGIWDDFGQELVITSGTDGPHSAQSKHHCGLALDFRSRYFTEEEVERVAERLQEALGETYYVLVEPTHIHVQFNG